MLPDKSYLYTAFYQTNTNHILFILVLESSASKRLFRFLVKVYLLLSKLFIPVLAQPMNKYMDHRHIPKTLPLIV